MRARPVVILASVMLLAGCASRTHLERDRAGPPACVLPLSEGPSLLDQCSRTSPADVASFWTPSSAQVRKAECSVRSFFNSNPAFARPFPEYSRQHLGIVDSAGRRFIHVNAFHVSILESFDFTEDELNWRARVVKGCDGGSAFWGALVDAEDWSMEHVARNGSI